MTNLYVTNTNPREAPKDLDDQRLIVACLESTQILITALFRRNLWNIHMYRPIWNDSHPCVVWAAHSKNNFRWVYHYAQSCCDEYMYRFGKEQDSYRIQISHCWDAFRAKEDVFPETDLSEFPNTTPFKTGLDADEAYRRYFNEEKWVYTIPKWTKRNEPSWRKSIVLMYPKGLFA